VSALVAGVREAAGHPSGPEIAADTGLATRAGHRPSGRRSFRKQRTVNPPIALGSFQPPLLFLNAALRPVASRRLPERLGPRASVTNVRIPTDAINRGRLACRSSGGRIASNERAIEESQLSVGGGVTAMSKYAVFFTLKGEAIARAMEQPSDRVTVVSKAVESAGGTLEAYYLMFGQYDGFVIVDLPDSRAAAATSLAVASTGTFEHLETHELIEAEDLNPILEQAKGITSQLPGT
jgi:uncharacterized protein with GYD domain